MHKHTYNKLLRIFRIISKDEFTRRTSKHYRVYRLLQSAKLFDEAWYKKTYLSENTKISALEHYVQEGCKLGNVPGKDFDAKKFFSGKVSSDLYGLFDKKNRNAFKLPHADENKIEKFIFEKRKILLFAHEFSMTGAPRILLNCAKILKKNGIEPVVLSPSFGALEEEFKQNDIEYYVEPLLMLKLLLQEETIKAFFQSFETIVFNSVVTVRYSDYISSNGKRILWLHEGDEGFQYINQHCDLQKSYQDFDNIYSGSALYSENFLRQYVPNASASAFLYGIDCIDLNKHDTQKAEKFTFTLTGFCSSRKGHDLFIDAIYRMPQDIKEQCEFKIIGKMDNDSFCRKIKKAAAKESCIKILGELPYGENLSEMLKSHVVVCPSRDDPMPMVCTEAMMLKIPVICSTQTGTASFLKDAVNGYLYDIDKDDLAQVMCRVFADKANFDKIIPNAYKIYQENFTQEIFEKNVLVNFADLHSVSKA